MDSRSSQMRSTTSSLLSPPPDPPPAGRVSSTVRTAACACQSKRCRNIHRFVSQPVDNAMPVTVFASPQAEEALTNRSDTIIASCPSQFLASPQGQSRCCHVDLALLARACTASPNSGVPRQGRCRHADIIATTIRYAHSPERANQAGAAMHPSATVVTSMQVK